jgi:cytoskeletal protein CcmA (bactofilin family)
MAQDEIRRAPAPDGGSRIGKSLSIQGDVTGGEDLEVEGRITGKIDLGGRDLTVLAGGRVEAEVHARNVVVHGEITGNVFASEKVAISESGLMKGDISALTVSVVAGAQFRGGIRMKKPLP